MRQMSPWMIAAARVGGLWLLILTLNDTFTGFGQNELVVLPFARQAVQPDWLASDWWLNHNKTYCWLFNQIFGRMTLEVGFEWTAILGRLLANLLFAFALERIFHAFDLPYVLGFLGAALFLENQSLVAYEWIVSGLEAKAFAYPLALLAAAFHIRDRHSMGFFLLGLAMSFHSLVGFYAVFCTVVTLALTAHGETVRQRLSYLTSAWTFAISGGIGLLELLRGALPRTGVDTTGIWEIYVLDRAPHHLYPGTWKDTPWVTEITLVTFFLILTRYLVVSRPVRFVTTYALVTLALFFVGVVVWIAGEIPLLRAYWFRFPDTMVPLIAFLLAGCWIDRLSSRPASLHALLSRSLQIAALALTVALVPRAVTQITRLLDHRSWTNPATASMDHWIREHTPRDAVFLISPARDDFYVQAQRPIVVNFKACPQQDAASMVEWFDRLREINQGRPFQGRGFQRMAEIRRSFEDLDDSTVAHLRDLYHARYFLTGSPRPYRFPAVHAADGLVLYDLTE